MDEQIVQLKSGHASQISYRSLLYAKRFLVFLNHLWRNLSTTWCEISMY
jgi:hypothetical protein